MNFDTALKDWGLLGLIVILASYSLYQYVQSRIRIAEERAKAEIAAEAKEDDAFNKTQQTINDIAQSALTKDGRILLLEQRIERMQLEYEEQGKLLKKQDDDVNKQIIEQANEISRLKNYEGAVDELRHQRQQLLEWIMEEGFIDKDMLIQQLRIDNQILETMLNTEYVEKDKNHE